MFIPQTNSILKLRSTYFQPSLRRSRVKTESDSVRFSVKFGLRAKQLEQDDSLYFLKPVEGIHFDRQGQELVPKKVLVDHIASQILADDVDAPGFFVMPVEPGVSNDERQIHRYAHRLLQAVHREIQNRGNGNFSELINLDSKSVKDGQWLQSDGFIMPYGRVERRLHIDPNADYFVNLYSPFKGVKGGNFKIFLYRSMLRERDHEFQDVFSTRDAWRIGSQPIIKPEMLKEAAPYVFEVALNNTDPRVEPGSHMLIFVNNRQVSHGVASAVFEDEESVRPFYRASISGAESEPVFWKPWLAQELEELRNADLLGRRNRAQRLDYWSLTHPD